MENLQGEYNISYQVIDDLVHITLAKKIDEFEEYCKKLDDDTFCSECGFDIKNNKTSTKSSNNFLETSILENKTIIIAGLIVVAILILAIGIVSFSSHTVTIDGIDFNIPAGYEENVDLRKDNELMPIVGGFLINYNFRGYEADNGDAIAIGVSTGNGLSLTEDVMFSMAPGQLKKLSIVMRVLFLK